MNTAATLAAALRRAFNESPDVPAGLDPNGAGWWSDAYRALRAYDAEQAARSQTTGQHTAEPWRPQITGTLVTIDAAAPVATFHGFRAKEDARRAAACVNACAGIPTSALEDAETIRITGEHADGDCFTFERGKPDGRAPLHDPRGPVPIPRTYPSGDDDSPRRYVKTGEFRAPKAGEFYLSGSYPAAYLAVADLTTCFHILRELDYV